MNKTIKYTLIIIMILSLLLNLYLLFTIGLLDQSWINEYDQNEIEWCEYMNDWIGLSNDLIYKLQYYNSAYDEVKITEEVDCWGHEEDE